MRKKVYRYGKKNYTNYIKTAGIGLEVGLKCGSKVLFTGNFIHSKEANAWNTQINKELNTFFAKYWATEDTSITFYNKLLTNFIYNRYYMFINKHLSKHIRTYNSEFNKDVRKYNTLKRNWVPVDKIKLKRAV